jgi:Tfp pilus assembly protein PilO
VENVKRRLAGLRYASRHPLARAGAWAVAAAGASMILALAAWWPAHREAAALDERLAAKRRALADARHGDALLAAYARASKDVASLEKKLRYAATQSQLVQDFARLARRHGVKIVSETYEETRGPQPSLSAELAVQGDYPALRDFVRDLSVLPTWSEVQEVRLESAQGAASQRGRIRIVTYRQAPADAGKPS